MAQQSYNPELFDSNVDSASASEAPDSSSQGEDSPVRFAQKLTKNIALSLMRVCVSALVALILPAYLTHRLDVATYGAWVLILQLGAFVNYLDLGVQTAVSKFVAEYDAKGDAVTAGRYASAGLAITTLSGLFGVLLILTLAWQTPRLFKTMPADLYPEVRIGVILIGLSLSFGLICSIFSSIFLGLQRYSFPIGLNILNRSAYALAIIVAVHYKAGLALMGAIVAAINFITASLQIAAWKRFVSHIRMTFWVERDTLTEVAKNCFFLALWTVGMLCVSGLDITIVGHYDFDQAAYYSTAVLPINFMLVIVSAIIGPILPASSALSTYCSATEMGDLLAKSTRYCTIFLLIMGLPLFIFGYPLLKLWVSQSYAAHGLPYLQILLIASIIRNICQPYATMVVATGKQRAATVAALAEAVVNLGSSIYLVRRWGAIGVAYGTLLGSFVSIGLHFALSMHFTYTTLMISRFKLFLVGIAKPFIIIVPSIILFLLPFTSASRSVHLYCASIWLVATVLLTWFAALYKSERQVLLHQAQKLVTRFR